MVAVDSTGKVDQLRKMPESVAERRRKILVGELPPDFLRLAVPAPTAAGPVPVSVVDPATAAELEQQHQQYAAAVQQQLYGFVPPNTRGRLSVTIQEANLVKNYGLVRMDPYCRVRVGNAVFETNTVLSGGRQPAWNRTVHAYLPNNVESIYIQIFDERAFSADECIAWAHIMLPQTIFNGESVDDYFHLSGQQGEGKEGMVHLVLAFAPVENPAANIQNVDPASVPPPPQPVEITDEDTKEIVAMFPEIDKEVIRCVLEERRGDKDATVSALLEMTQSK
ncbi:unnamed protein product [Caenorhabditis auriculariae]|uniref:Toll-interacting protein n=1 Tax=Caenorhabditis auriculariae TaxID=2777116 RepID=A0A8S1HME3_9PELO|nr:unnamed protein product [Caenorhabditis auriculariae]